MQNYKRIVEEWKEYELALPGRVRYAVSNHGRLKSFTTDIKEGRIIKPALCDGFPYLRYKRVINGKRKDLQHGIHKMIGELFMPKDNEYQTYVLHLNHKKLDNHLSNLKWATHEEMVAHSKNSPAVIEAKKNLLEFNIKRDGAKLTSTDVIRLKKKILDPNRKTRLRLIAKEFGISEMQLHRIKTGENWGHIKVNVPTKKVEN